MANAKSFEVLGLSKDASLNDAKIVLFNAVREQFGDELEIDAENVLSGDFDEALTWIATHTLFKAYQAFVAGYQETLTLNFIHPKYVLLFCYNPTYTLNMIKQNVCRHIEVLLHGNNINILSQIKAEVRKEASVDKLFVYQSLNNSLDELYYMSHASLARRKIHLIFADLSIPNIHVAVKSETLELMEKVVSSEEDLFKRSKLFEQWRERGGVNSHKNPNTDSFFCLWTTNRFFRTWGSLRDRAYSDLRHLLRTMEDNPERIKYLERVFNCRPVLFFSHRSNYFHSGPTKTEKMLSDEYERYSLADRYGVM